MRAAMRSPKKWLIVGFPFGQFSGIMLSKKGKCNNEVHSSKLENSMRVDVAPSDTLSTAPVYCGCLRTKNKRTEPLGQKPVMSKSASKLHGATPIPRSAVHGLFSFMFMLVLSGVSAVRGACDVPTSEDMMFETGGGV